MADINDDQPIQKSGTSKWLWVGVIVVLAILAIIVFANPSGDRDVDPVVTDATQEERLSTDISNEEQMTQQAMEDVNGASRLETAPTDSMDESQPAQ